MNEHKWRIKIKRKNEGKQKFSDNHLSYWKGIASFAEGFSFFFINVCFFLSFFSRIFCLIRVSLWKKHNFFLNDISGCWLVCWSVFHTLHIRCVGGNVNRRFILIYRGLCERSFFLSKRMFLSGIFNFFLFLLKIYDNVFLVRKNQSIVGDDDGAEFFFECLATTRIGNYLLLWI